MKKKTNLLKVLGIVTVLALTGCDSTNTSNDVSHEEVDVEGIVITSLNNVKTIKVDDTLQLTAKVYPLNALQEVSWSSSDSSIAVVDENGLVTGVKQGTVNIIATSVADESISQTFSLIVERKDIVVVDAESISLSSVNGETTFKVGEQLSLSAIIYPAEASQGVEWSSSDETIATVSNGVVSALKEGSVTIYATCRKNEEIKASIELTIEKGQAPEVSLDWGSMEYTTHDEYVNSDSEIKLKVKGVVTHIYPISEGLVNYFIQNGTEGYYVYNQNASLYPVEVGKSYEIGGYRKYYHTGINEIVDVEYYVPLDEKINYYETSLDDKNVSELNDMNKYHASYVSASEATIKKLPSNYSKAYSVNVSINGNTIDLRVDPKSMSNETFEAINAKFSSSTIGATLSVKGYMVPFGYGTPKPQILVVDDNDLVFGELSAYDYVDAAQKNLYVDCSLEVSDTNIQLPSTIEKYEKVSITWSSDNEIVNVDSKSVTHLQDDTVVTLTATISYKEESITKEFKVNVFGSKELVSVASLDLEDALPAGQYGTSETKSSYKEGNVTLNGHTWMLRNTLIGCDQNDVVDGTMAMRLKANTSEETTARVELLDDVNCNYIQFDAAVYGSSSKGVTLGVAYSSDSGATWVDTNMFISLNSHSLETYRVKLGDNANRVAIYVVAGSGDRVNVDNVILLK